MKICAYSILTREFRFLPGCELSENASQIYIQMEKIHAAINLVLIKAGVWITVTVFSIAALFPISFALVRYPQPEKWISPLGYRYGVMTRNTALMFGEIPSCVGRVKFYSLYYPANAYLMTLQSFSSHLSPPCSSFHPYPHRFCSISVSVNFLDSFPRLLISSPYLENVASVSLRFYYDWLVQAMATILYYVIVATSASFLIGITLFVRGMITDLRAGVADLHNQKSDELKHSCLIEAFTFHGDILM